MILWMRRGAAVWSGIFLMALLLPNGSRWAGMAGGILNLAWAMAEKLPYPLSRFLSAPMLLINGVFSAYGVLSGGPPVFALLAVGGSLISWNAGLLNLRWSDAPPSIQNRYMRHLGGTIALGLAAGLSALALQGQISIEFLPAFSLVLIGSVLFLRLISGSFQKEKR